MKITSPEILVGSFTKTKKTPPTPKKILTKKLVEGMGALFLKLIWGLQLILIFSLLYAPF